jgi:Flp pilus assembly pilin Flp
MYSSIFPSGLATQGKDADNTLKQGFCAEIENPPALTGANTRFGASLFPPLEQAHDQRGSRMIRRLLKDESGQTMLEYIVIVVFVVIMAIVGFRLVKGIVRRSIVKASRSIEQ